VHTDTDMRRPIHFNGRTTSTSEAKRPMRPNSCSIMPLRRRIVSTPCADEDFVVDIEGKEVSRFRIEALSTHSIFLCYMCCLKLQICKFCLAFGGNGAYILVYFIFLEACNEPRKLAPKPEAFEELKQTSETQESSTIQSHRRIMGRTLKEMACSASSHTFPSSLALSIE
jgi:hypothetical protein